MHRWSYTLTATATALALLTGCAHEQRSVQPIPQTNGKVHPLLEMRPVPFGLGVNTHFYRGSNRDWSLLAESGMDIVRTDVSWSRFERSPGQYDHSRHDALIENLERHDMWLLWMIGYDNALYDPEAEKPGNWGIRSEKARQASARFCAALARRYKGKKIIWELWNEPNIMRFWAPKPNPEEYLAWCRAVAAAIRKVDPKACILAPGLSRFDFPFLEACFSRGLLEFVDGVTVHPYRGAIARFPKVVDPKPRLPRGCHPESVLDDYTRLRRLIDRHKPAGKGIPVVSGEWGYTTTYVTHELQGKYLARQWLTNMSAGVPISIWYDWSDDGPNPRDMEHNFGTVTLDRKPQPAYIAAKTLIAQLHGYTVVGRIELASDKDFAVIFAKGDDRKLTVWTRGEPHTIELGAGIRIDGAVDHLGNAINVPNGSSQEVTDAPRYLTIASPFPTWLVAE